MSRVFVHSATVDVPVVAACLQYASEILQSEKVDPAAITCPTIGDAEHLARIARTANVVSQ